MYESMYLAQWLYKRGIGRRLGAWVSLVGGGWHLFFFFAIEQDDGTRNHLPAPGQQGLSPTHLLPGQELHLLIRDPPPLSSPHPPAPLLSSKHPLYQGHNDFIFHKQWTILKGCHRLAELYWMWFYLLSFFRYMYFIIFNDLYSFVWGRQYCKNFYLIKFLYD